MVPTRHLFLVLAWHSLFLHITTSRSPPKDCAEVRPWLDGAYVIRPEGFQEFGVLCKFDADGSIWTLIQNNVNDLGWRRDWSQYRNGFGWMEFDRSFWLGLEKIHWLTSPETRNYVLRIDVTGPNGTKLYADYENFSISDEANNYYLSYGSFLGGSAGDGLRGYHRNKAFSARDRDNDGDLQRKCADIHGGGWWYDSCGLSSLNRASLYWNETSSYYVNSTMRIRAL